MVRGYPCEGFGGHLGEGLRLIEVRSASFAFDGSERPVVRDVSLKVLPGEILALVGANGSGKSTLAGLVKGSLVPTDGAVTVDGFDAASREAWPLVGCVRQDPTSQIVSSQVYDEVAFGPRNLGLPPCEVNERVHEALGVCRLSDVAGRSVDELSGGERQRLALAGVLALHPRYVILDEATSQLDTQGRLMFMRMVRGLAREGVGILMITHALAEVAEAHRVALLEKGALAWEGDPSELLESGDLLERRALAHDPFAQVLQVSVGAGFIPRPASDLVDDLGDFLQRHSTDQELVGAVLAEPKDLAKWGKAAEAAVGATGTPDQVVHMNEAAATAGLGGEVPRLREKGELRQAADATLAVQQVTVRYAAEENPALSDVTLRVDPGSIVLVAGASGSGKSTLARVVAGVLAPQEGEALLGGRAVRPGQVGLSFQRVEEQVFCSTVLEDVCYGPRNRGLAEEDVRREAARSLHLLGVDEGLWGRSPLELSGGQRRRVALAGILALEPGAYVFDEPTAGLDGEARVLLHDVVRRLAAAGNPVAVISHDLDEWLDVASRVVLLRQGRVVFDGPAGTCRVSEEPFRRAGLVPPPLVRLRAGLASRGRSGAPSERSGTGTCNPPDGIANPASGADGSSRGSQESIRAQEPQTGDTEAGLGREGARPQTQRVHRPSALPLGIYLSTGSPVHNLDARVKVLLVLVLTVAAFAAHTPLQIAVLLALVLACQRAAGVPGSSLAGALKPTLVVLLFVLLANALRLDGTADFALVGALGLSTGGLARGLVAVGRIVVVVGGVLVVSSTTTGPRIADALGALLAPLGHLGAPVDDWSMVLSVALRFLPASVATFWEVRDAQRARGTDFDEGSVGKRLGRWTAVLVPMVVALFQKAADLAQAMRDRCYGYGPRTQDRHGLRLRDVAVLVAGVALLAIACRLPW